MYHIHVTHFLNDGKLCNCVFLLLMENYAVLLISLRMGGGDPAILSVITEFLHLFIYVCNFIDNFVLIFSCFVLSNQFLIFKISQASPDGIFICFHSNLLSLGLKSKTLGKVS